MSKKQNYRIRNWAEYNESLVQRGNLTIWVDNESIDQWYEDASNQKKGKGCPRVYSDVAILCALTIKAVFKLPLRATEGFIKSLLTLMNLDLSVPDYTTLCRRQSQLDIALPCSDAGQAKHIVIDSTGLKIFGEGEWKVRQHGYKKRRTWRKLHLGVNAETQEIEVAVVTTNDMHDSEVFNDILERIEGDIDKVSADGAYDSHEIFKKIAERSAEPLIPPRKTAKIEQHGNCKKAPLPRDEVLREIRRCGRKKWKEKSGYHKRSLAETAMFRIKQLFGDQLASRCFENQAVEAFIRCLALNKMTGLGMPESYPTS